MVPCQSCPFFGPPCTSSVLDMMVLPTFNHKPPSCSLQVTSETRTANTYFDSMINFDTVRGKGKISKLT